MKAQVILPTKVEGLWDEFHNCVKRIHTHMENARSLCRDLKSHECVTTQTLFAAMDIPSSESIAMDYELKKREFKQPPSQWDKFCLQNYHVDTSMNDIRSIWQAWEVGSPSMPSISFMNKKYGTLAFEADPHKQAILYGWGKIVEEIVIHLELGRDIDEILAVGKLYLSRVGGNVSKLARWILDNMENDKLTFFEMDSSSRGSM